VRWLEAVVQEAHDSKTGLKESIVLELRGGGRVEISHAKQLRKRHAERLLTGERATTRESRKCQTYYATTPMMARCLSC
jgi:hypothetical protein